MSSMPSGLSDLFAGRSVLKRRLLNAVLLPLATLAAAPLASQTPGRRYFEDLSGVTLGSGVTPAQAAANSSAINSALTTGGAWYMRSGDTIAISAALVMVSNESITGEGPVKPVLFMTTGFTNVIPTDNQNIGTNATAILATGQTSSPFTSIANVQIRNIEINGNRQSADNRFLSGIVVRDAIDPAFVDVTVHNMPAGYGIRADTIIGHPTISGFQAYDFYSNANFGTGYGGAQLTGIQVDSGRTYTSTSPTVVVSSTNISITHPVIHDITEGSTFITAHGDQSDGITLVAGTGHAVINAEISNVGEGIDNFSTDGQIIGGRFDYCREFGLKFIHGAARFLVTSPYITRPGIAGIVFAGGVIGPVTDIRVINPQIINIDPDHLSTQSFGIKFDANSGSSSFPPQHISVVGGRIYPGNGQSVTADWVDGTVGPDIIGTDIELGSPTTPGAQWVQRVAVNAGGFANLQMVRALGSSTYTAGTSDAVSLENSRFNFAAIGGAPYVDLPPGTGLSYAGSPVVNASGKIAGQVPAYTSTTLPPAGKSGRLAMVSDASGGNGGSLFMDNGGLWTPIGTPGTALRGDGDGGFVYPGSPGVQVFNVPLTANRTSQLLTTNAVDGATVLTVRTAAATGSYTLTITGLANSGMKTLLPGTWARAYYAAGIGWIISEAGSL